MKFYTLVGSPKSKNEFVMGQNATHTLPSLPQLFKSRIALECR